MTKFQTCIRYCVTRLSSPLASARHCDDTYDYSSMPRVAVIFVCTFDPFGAGLRRYTGRTVYGGAPEADDGAVTVFLNAGGLGGDIDPDLAAFLDYVAGRDVTRGRSAFVDDVERAVEAGNEDGEFLGGIVDINEKLWISKQEGLTEGEATQQRRISQLARRMAADGRQDELVATLTDKGRLEEEFRHYGIE